MFIIYLARNHLDQPKFLERDAARAMIFGYLIRKVEIDGGVCSADTKECALPVYLLYRWKAEGY